MKSWFAFAELKELNILPINVEKTIEQSMKGIFLVISLSKRLGKVLMKGREGHAGFSI